jgi:hypothetical protein
MVSALVKVTRNSMPEIIQGGNGGLRVCRRERLPFRPPTFSFEGEITYQNGFGDGIRDTFCWKWLPPYMIKFKSGLANGGGSSFVLCRNFDQRVRLTLEAEKQAENGADRPDPPL